MPAQTVRVPSYRLHKPSGQAVVTLRGRDVYLGKHGSPESRAEYARVAAEWLSTGTAPAPPGEAGPDISVAELILAYLKFADTYYLKNGRPTKEPALLRLSFRALRQLYGHSPARDFGPLAIKAVRKAMLDAKLSRPEINRRVGRIVRAFRWAVENEMVPPSVHHGLKAVSGLKRGRTEAREPAPIGPVPEADVDAIKPHVSRQVWGLIQLQRFTGMRPGEACQIRTGDLDRSGEVWAYTPRDHKTAHHGRKRTIFLGPKAQAVVTPWLREDPDAFLFSPREATEARWAEQRKARRSPIQPSQRDRKKARPKRAPGECYSVYSYRQAIAVACKKGKGDHWHPHQLRHNAATQLRKEFGLDVARVVLGHSSAAVTEVYAEADNSKAMAAMGQVG